MTKPNYIDQCLERAEKATEGPWKQIGNEVVSKNHEANIKCYGIALNQQLVNNSDFIAHARTDVPELARRLKRACLRLREKADTYSHRGANVQHHLWDELRELADELEAPLEGDK